MEELRIKLKCPFCRANIYTTVSWPGPNLYLVRVTCGQCEGLLTQVILNGRQPDLEETIWDYVVDPDTVELDFEDFDGPEEEYGELPWEERHEEGLFEWGQQPINFKEGAAIIAALNGLARVPTDRELGI